MNKCSQCRKMNSELCTPWERFRNWCFEWFIDDIADLSQEKYTQGFSDGWCKGRQSALDDEFKIRKVYEEK